MNFNTDSIGSRPLTLSEESSQPPTLSDEFLLEICEAADVIACQCPGYLARLTRQVRAFRHYTENCIETFPEDAETHRWLSHQAEAVETLLFETIVELMKREELLDSHNQVMLDKMAAKAREMVIRQLGSNI